MPATLTDETDVPIEPDPAPEPEPEPDDDRLTISRAQLEETMRRELVRARLTRGGVAAHPLARFPSLAVFASEAYNGGSIREFVTGGGDRPLGAQIARAWVAQLTTENPGVIPPGWISDVFGIVDHGRPVITGIGTRALPESGMEVNWPYFDGDLSLLVGEQTVEKTEITSVKVMLKRGTAPITTFAGGSDVSYQLIRRSSPSYRDAYLRIMSAAYALVTDKAATLDLVDLATGFQQLSAAATIDEFRAAVFAASVKVEAATGSPASTVILSTDLFVDFGSALLPAAYGTQNVSGTADASSLNVSVSGLRVVHGRYLPAATGIVTNGQAAAWAEDGPFVISAPDVPKLGEDTAIWGMGALEVTAPAGVVILAATQPAAASTTTTTKKSAASS